MGAFVPNDVQLGRGDPQQQFESSVAAPTLILLSGPNMGGKSTILRQVQHKSLPRVAQCPLRYLCLN